MSTSVHMWLPYALIGLTFAITVVSVVLSTMLFFSVVPAIERNLDKITEGINQVTLATTETVQTIQRSIVSVTDSVQKVLLAAKDTILILQQGIHSGVYAVEQVKDAITGALTPSLVRMPEPSKGSAVYSIEKGTHAGSSLMRHPSVVSNMRTPLPRWYKSGGHLTDHIMLSSQAIAISTNPRIHHSQIELTGQKNLLSIRHTSVHEVQLTWSVSTQGPLSTDDPEHLPLRLYIPDPIMNGHTSLTPVKLQDILISSHINGKLVDLFFNQGNDYLEAWYRETKIPVIISSITGNTVIMRIQIHLLVSSG